MHQPVPPSTQYRAGCAAWPDDRLATRLGCADRSSARVLRDLEPQVVHTRNLAALEMQVAAWWAGIPLRVHGEHGWDMRDPVGRMQTVKAQPLLANAFVQALERRPDLRATLRLVMVGAGPLKAECEQILSQAGLLDLAWLPGERSDVPAVMQGLDLFVLPSLAEGISNTILEAMACGLPVVATAVGGNADLVEDGVTGQIVPAGDVPALAGALCRWADDAAARRAAGAAGRARVEARFSLPAMVAAYQGLYERAVR